MKIAIIAPPWLSTYPGCYYGIENVIQNLTSQLHEKGHEVVLFGVGGSTTAASKVYSYHNEGQYHNIHRAWYEAVPIISSHILYSLNIIVSHGDFDIIHDHNSFVGPAMMAFAYRNLPPVLHTLHEPFTNLRLIEKGIPDNRMLFEELKHAKNMYFSGVSESQLSTAPKDMDSKVLEVVPNGVDLNDYTYRVRKDDYFLCVGRIAKDKGQGTAAQLCSELDVPLKLAGTIGGNITTARKAKAEILNPTASSLENNPHFAYFRKEVYPYLKKGKIEYLGAVFGPPKKKLFANAKAFLAPIEWEEPFGISLIDALASGTPVIANNRGAFPEIIQHGRNGFLANSVKEFREYMQRIDEIDPRECRKSVEERFSADVMADRYIALYERVIDLYTKQMSTP
tara:strand:+ start:938 stop:2125 length:1188 start_codon:yes stop_codon:yes gene_type:complete